MSSADDPNLIESADTVPIVSNTEERNNYTLTDNPPDVSTIEAAPITASEEDPLNVAANESEIIVEDNSSAPTTSIKNENVGFDSPAMETDVIDSKPLDQPLLATSIPKDVSEQKIRFLEDRIAMAEADRDKANIMLADTANRNSGFKRELENFKLEANERVAFIRNLEAENIRLRKECEFLKQKNDLSSKETQKWKNDSDRFCISNQMLSDQLSSLKVLTNELRDKNLSLHFDINSLKDKFQIIEFEREKYRQELLILSNSKQFYSNLESQAEDEKDDMRTKLFRLETEVALANGSLELGRQNVLNEQRRCQQEIEQKNGELALSKADFSALSTEHESLKAVLEESKAERETLQTKLSDLSNEVVKERNQVNLIRQQYKQKMTEFNTQLLATKTENEELRLKAETEIGVKDNQIAELKTEIEKLNERLQLYAKMSNAGDPESMAPAASRTANMLKNANSLTEIYAEHFNLINELESTKADMSYAERTITQLREILIEHEPIIRERQEHYDQSIREVEILREQLERHRRDRDELISTRDAYSHELHFTKESLEKYQRECQTLSKQVQHLTLQTTGMPSNDESSELFSSVQELQQKNLELISRIKTMEVEKDETIRNAQDSQFNELKQKLEIANKTAETIELRNRNLVTCKNEAEKQRDYYKSLHDERQKGAGGVMEPRQIAELKREIESLREQTSQAEHRLSDAKTELERVENQMKEKDSTWLKSSTEAKALIEQLNFNIERKQQELKESLTEKQQINRVLRELEVRHRVQTNHVNFLEASNRNLLDKNGTISSQLRELTSAKLDFQRQLMYAQNSISIYQIELEAVRKRVSSDSNLTSAISELSAVVDRKKLLQESWNNNAINTLKSERDEWKHKAEILDSEASSKQNELQAQVIKFQNECIRLEVEWETARKLVTPLETENNELRTQCRELGDDLIACQKLISEKQMNQLTETVALNESSLLKKQLSEALETAEYWQNIYEKSILANSKPKSQIEDQSNDSNSSNLILSAYVSECRERLSESSNRITGLLNQISSLETKNQQLLDDLQLADSFTNSQAERITQMETEIKQFVDKLNQITTDSERLRAENVRLTTNSDELRDQNSKFEDELKEVQSAFNAAEITKMELHKIIEDRIHEYSQKLDLLRNQKATYEADHARLEAELTASQQREAELNSRLIETRQEIDQLCSANTSDATISALRRTIEQMQAERKNETALRFQLTADIKQLRTQDEHYQQTISTLRSDLEAANNEVQAKSDLLNQQKDKIGMFNSLQTRIDELSNTCSDLQKEINNSQTERSQLKTKIEVDVAAQQDLKQQIETLESGLKENIIREKVVKDELKKSNELVTKLRALANDYKLKYTEVLAKFEEHKAQLANVNRHEQETQKLRDDLTLKTRELENVRIQLSSAQEAVSNAAAQSVSSMPGNPRGNRLLNPIRSALGQRAAPMTGRPNVVKELQIKTKQLEELTAKNSELESKLSTAEKRVRELEAEIANLNEQIIELMSDNGNRQKEIIELNGQLEEKDKEREDEISQLKLRNEMIQKTLENARKKCDTYKQELDALRLQLDSQSTLVV